MGKQRLSDGIDVHYGEYAISGVTVINSSRQLRNITALRIDATEIINSSRQLVNVAGYTQTSGNASIEHASSPTFEIKDTTNNVTFKAYAQDSNAFVGTTSSHTLNIGTANTAAMTVDTSQVVTFADDIVVPDQIIHAGDTDTYLQFSAANVFRVVVAGSQRFKVTNSTVEIANDVIPGSNDTYDLGSTANAWKELHVEDIRFHNASGAVGGIGQYNTGGDIEILSDHNIVFKETDAGTIKAVFGMNGPNFTFGQTTENTSYRVYVNGSIASTADVTAYASDERLKTNIVEIDSAIEKVKQLRGVTFDWQDDVEEKGFEPSAKHETGVIAQEVQKVIPDAVVPAPFDPEYWTVKHEKIIPVLIEAIKEQQKEIEQLKKHSHPAKDMCDMNGYEELVARIEKMEKNYGNN